MSHLSQDEILGFAAGRFDAAMAERLYEHLGDCEACWERYAAVREIREDFEGSWEAFVAEVWARREGLAPAAESSELVLRGALDGTRRLATAALEKLSGALRSLGDFEVVLQPAVVGVGDPTRTDAAGRLAERAAALYAEGKEEEALAILQEASGLDRRVGECASLDLLSRGEKVGEVIVDAGRRAVSVIIPHDPAGPRGGAAVLIPENATAPPQRVSLEPVPGTSYSLAEFEYVPDGRFSLRLELGEQ